MISTDFAPNETGKDAALAISLLVQPHRWQTGKETQELKQKLLAFFPSNQADLHFFFTGRSALHSLFNALDLKAGDEVAVQAFTCEAVVLPLIDRGVLPIYIDVDPQTYSMDASDLEKKISGKTKAVILQHTFGILPNRKPILKIAQKNNLMVIEDLAHGFNKEWAKSEQGTEPLTNRVGLGKWGRDDTIKLLSFGRSKAFSSVFGGAIIAHPEIIEKLKKEQLKPVPNGVLRQLLSYIIFSVIIKKTYEIGLGKIIHKITQYLHLFIPEISLKEKRGEYDSFYQLAYPNVLSILLLMQLNKYDKTYETRTQRAMEYIKAFDIKNIHLASGIIRFPLHLPNSDEIKKRLADKDIFLGSWYNQVVAPRALPLEKVQYKLGSCKTAEQLSQTVINLPTLLSDDEAALVIQTLKKYNVDIIHS